jgi:hypothetical protein
MIRNVCYAIVVVLGTLPIMSTLAHGSEARQHLFGNDYVDVYRLTIEPGEELPLHAGNERIVYSLSDYTIAWTETGQEDTETKKWREGDVHAHEALDHSVKNIGNTIADFLVIVRSDESVAKSDHGRAVSEIQGSYAALIAELDHATVFRVALPAGARQPMHEGTARLVYSLNDYSLVFSTPSGDESEADFDTGDVHWHDAGPHAAANIGDETARFVIFALR